MKIINKKYQINIVFFCLLSFSTSLKAQLAPFFDWDEIEVYDENDERYLSPWTGGMNNPQFSQIDWNADGLQDLFVFDRSGHSMAAFVFDAAEGYVLENEYLTHFPRLFDWVMMEDFNNDNLPDIFTYNVGGFKVYESFIENGEWHFQLYADKLRYNEDKKIFITRIDIPALKDVDHDGDLDILTFDSIGGFLEWYANRGVEWYGNSDTMVFELATECWGEFEESFDSPVLELGVGCGGLKAETTSEHSGSTSLLLDIDYDGDEDLLLGDVASTYLNLLTNGGDSNEAIVVSQDTMFPSNSERINVFNFPAAYAIDFTQDGNDDLLVASNDAQASFNKNHLWAYERIDTHFVFRESNFLVKQMVDVGSRAFPKLVDYNNDGLLDLLIGRLSLFTPSDSVATAGITLFTNTGTAETPVFEWTTDDFSNLSELGLNGLYPDFADLDGDGDLDMIAGERTGFLHYFENVGEGVMDLQISIPQMLTLGGAKNVVPSFYDVNEDGKLDLLIGEEFGRLFYFINTSDETGISFELENDFFGEIDLRDSLLQRGNSVPLTIGDEILVGAIDGTIKHFTEINENSINQEAWKFADIFISGMTGLTAGDLNNDGHLELIAGNAKGGLHLLTQNPEFNGIISVRPKPLPLQVFPNPASEFIEVRTDEMPKELILYNTLGQQWHFTNTNKISVKEMPSGVYFLKINNRSAKVLIQH